MPLVLTLAALPAWAQTTTPTPLPPAAQAAVDKGVLAAKQQDYLLAVRYFQDARKLAPLAPEVYYDLGLAESKIPGRELRAIAWFGAFLAASPNASNAAAVKDLINMLDVKSQSNITRLIKTTQDAASQVEDSYRDYDYRRVAVLYAKAGDITAALTVADLIRYQYEKREAQVDIASEQADAGDIRGALKTADLIQDAHLKIRAKTLIAYPQAKAGDIAGAQKTAELIQYANDKAMLLLAIAEAQLKLGERSGAQQTLGSVMKTIDLIPEENLKQDRLYYLAIHQARAGDISGAQKTADLIRNEVWLAMAQQSVARAQATAGDIAGALKTADRIEKAKDKGRAEFSIAAAQADAGDIAGALKTADLIEDAEAKSWALRDIALAQAIVGDFAGAQKTADLISIPESKDYALKNIALEKARLTHARNAILDWTWIFDNTLNTEPLLDLSGYLKSLPSKDFQQVFSGLYNAASSIIAGQIRIDQLLKTQAKQ